MSNKYEGLTDEQILSRLLEVDGVPEKTVGIPRLGIPVKLRGLTTKEVFSVQERATRKGKKGEAQELSAEDANVGYIVAATVSPDWKNKALLDKYKASTPEELLKRLLLAGEVTNLANEVMDLSGFTTELDEVKN